MAYSGSEAYRLDQEEEPNRWGNATPQVEHGQRFRALEGGGLDARAREGVSPRFWSAVKLALVTFAVALILACAHVAIRANTVSLMATNNRLSSQISETQEENRDLQVTRSVLSSKDRIVRIATQNYGMVQKAPSATVVVSSGE